MPSFRLYPLLVAGVAGLTLAACGGDDDPPAQAGVPAQTESAPAQTAPAETPTTSTAPDAAASTDADGAATDAETPNSVDQSAPDPPSGDRAASDFDEAKPDAQAQQQQQGAGTLQDKLKDYAAGGKPASKEDAADVRDSMTAFQAAIASKDRDRICAATVGLPEKTEAKKSGISCESLSTSGASKPPSAEDRKMIASAKITVNGDKAIAELGQGFPLPFRKVDGRWRLDYGKMMSISAGSR